MAATAPPHHGDRADLRAWYPPSVVRKGTRHVRARAAMAGLLQHHVHEPRAPEATAAGGIAADIAARVGDEVGRTEAARRGEACLRGKAALRGLGAGGSNHPAGG